jgi:hypothetical protein
MPTLDLDTIKRGYVSSPVSVSASSFTAWVTENWSGLSTYASIVDAVRGVDDLNPRVLSHEMDDANGEPSLEAMLVASVCNIELTFPDSHGHHVESDMEIVARLAREEYELSVEGHVLPRKGPQFTLERENWHPRDARILFDDLTHSYHLLDETSKSYRRFPGSVSSAYGAFFEHFDARKVVTKLWPAWMRSRDHRNHALTNAVVDFLRVSGDAPVRERVGDKEVDVLVRVMSAVWGRKNRLDSASEKGTRMHAAIEWFMNGTPMGKLPSQLGLLEHRGEPTMLQVQFESFCREVMEGEGLKPYRTEWSVYDEDSFLSGQIDCIVVDARGDLHMIDWKRCKNPDLGPDQASFRVGASPCDSIPDNDFGHYSMQQNIYRAILEKNYGLKIVSMRLAQFHPYALERYRMIRVPDHQEVAHDIMRLRTRDGGTGTRKRAADPPPSPPAVSRAKIHM